MMEPSRGLAPTDRWGAVLMFGDDCLQHWSALGVAQARLPLWGLTGHAVGSSRPPSRRNEVIVTGWQWHLELLHFPGSSGLAGAVAARGGNPGIQEYRDAEWREHDRFRQVLNSSRSVDGASRHHKLEDGDLMPVRRKRHLPVTDHAVTG